MHLREPYLMGFDPYPTLVSKKIPSRGKSDRNRNCELGNEIPTAVRESSCVSRLGMFFPIVFSVGGSVFFGSFAFAWCVTS